MSSSSPFKAQATIFKAMAHPSRLHIMNVLQAGEMCVSDIAHALDADITAVSKHLSTLKTVGLVEDRRQGLQVFYRLRVPCITSFILCVEEVVCAAYSPAESVRTSRSNGNGCGCRTRQ